MAERLYIGLDVGSSFCQVTAMDPQGTVVADLRFPTSERKLIETFESIKGELHVHLEAAELAGWIRRVLKPRVARVLISHAKTNAWIAKDPLKRDSVDAFKLADLLRMGRVHEVYYADEDHRTLFKQMVQHYDDLTRQQVRLKIKIKARFRTQGVIARGEGLYGTSREAWLKKVPSELGRQMIKHLYQLLDQTLAMQGEARSMMRRESQRYPEIARFDEVPGVGLIGACRFSAYIQTPYRFSNKRKLWRYCRLGITCRSSDGKPLGREALDYNGNGYLKDMSRHAFEGAMRTKRDHALKRFYHQSLQRTHDRTHARLSTQRKILAVLQAMWKGGTQYSDDKG